MRVVFQSVQSRTNYQHCYILVSQAVSGMYWYDGNWCIEPKMGQCCTGFMVYRVLVYNPNHKRENQPSVCQHISDPRQNLGLGDGPFSGPLGSLEENDQASAHIVPKGFHIDIYIESGK